MVQSLGMKNLETCGPTGAIDSHGIQRLLIEHESSDLSLAAFARQNGVAPHRLYHARRASRKREVLKASGGFAEVRVVEPGEPSPSAVELLLTSGLVIRVGRGFDEVVLRRLLGLLAGC